MHHSVGVFTRPVFSELVSSHMVIHHKSPWPWSTEICITSSERCQISTPYMFVKHLQLSKFSIAICLSPWAVVPRSYNMSLGLTSERQCWYCSYRVAGATTTHQHHLTITFNSDTVDLVNSHFDSIFPGLRVLNDLRQQPTRDSASRFGTVLMATESSMGLLLHQHCLSLVVLFAVIMILERM